MDTEPTDPSSPTRRRKALLVGAVALAVLVAAGVAGAVIVENRNAGAAVAAVREYVDTIARGDAAAANALVDPERASEDVDLDLLSNDMLGAAQRRIEIDDVVLDPAVDPDSTTAVVVRVDYRLGSEPGTAALRVERAGTTAGVLDDWRVVEPLLVPVRIETNVPVLATARFGAADVPVAPVFGEERPDDRFLVYPAAYPLRGARSRHLAAEPATVNALNGGRGFGPGSEAWVQAYYAPTGELVSLVTTRIDAYASACAGGRTDVRCPRTMEDAIEAGGTNLRVDKPSSVERIVPESKHCDARSCLLGVETSTGEFSYTGRDGTTKSATFQVFATITMTPADEITIEFY